MQLLLLLLAVVVASSPQLVFSRLLSYPVSADISANLGTTQLRRHWSSLGSNDNTAALSSRKKRNSITRLVGPSTPGEGGGGGGIHIYQECNIELAHEDDPWPGRHRRQTSVPGRCRRDVGGGVRCVDGGDEEPPLALAGGGLNIYISCHHKGDQGVGSGGYPCEEAGEVVGSENPRLLGRTACPETTPDNGDRNSVKRKQESDRASALDLFAFSPGQTLLHEPMGYQYSWWL